MAWQAHPSVVPLSLGAGLLVANAVYLALRQRGGERAPGQWFAVALFVAFAVSVGAFALESLHTGRSAKILWNQIQYVGDATIAAFLLGYVLVYVGYDHSWQSFVALFTLPTVTLVAVFTNHLHNQFWTSLSTERLAGLVVLDNGHGPFFYLYILYTYTFVLVALGLLARTAFDSEGTDRTHLVALTIGVIGPAVAGVVYLLEVGPAPTPNYPGYAYLLTAGVVTYSVHQQDLFTLVPVARRTTIEQMGEGVVVLDTSDRVVSANDTARALLPGDDRTLVGTEATVALESLEPELDFDTSHQEFTVETTDHVLDVTVEPLTRGEHTVGSLVVLTDVTVRHRREQRLEAQNRKLELLNKLVRHDIRNEATLIRDMATRVERGEQSGTDEYVSHIAEGSERIVDYTEQARELMAVISKLTDDLDAVPLPETVERELVGASTLDASATVRTDGKLPDVAVRANEMLGSLVRNLLVNAIQHNNTDDPTVVVTGERNGDEVTVTVADDGPGIPDSEREAVFAEGKTLSESEGTGFGLYLVATLVDQYGGSVEIADSSLGGTAVSVTLAVADERPPESVDGSARSDSTVETAVNRLD